MNCFQAFLTLSVLMVRNFYCNGNPPVQMLCYFGAQLRPHTPGTGLRPGNRWKKLAALRQEPHFNGPVDQLVGNGYLVFPLAVIIASLAFLHLHLSP